jgi:hypothetical protein
MRTFIAGALMFLCTTACTPYQHDWGFLSPGGFTENQIAADAWLVRFRGNGFTTHERTADMAIMRAAEIAIEHGYKWFVLAASYEETTTQTSTFYQSQWNGNGVTSYSVPFSVSFPKTSSWYECLLIATPIRLSRRRASMSL